jgi:hypothetical protein
MKINEKNLYTFANSKPVDKEGEASGEAEKSFHKNFFTFDFSISFSAIFMFKVFCNSNVK